MLSFGVELDLHTQVRQVSLSRDRWQPHRRAGEPGPPRLHRTPSALLSCSLRPHRHPPVLEQATTLPARVLHILPSLLGLVSSSLRSSGNAISSGVPSWSPQTKCQAHLAPLLQPMLYITPYFSFVALTLVESNQTHDSSSKLRSCVRAKTDFAQSLRCSHSRVKPRRQNTCHKRLFTELDSNSGPTWAISLAKAVSPYKSSIDRLRPFLQQSPQLPFLPSGL